MLGNTPSITVCQPTWQRRPRRRQSLICQPTWQRRPRRPESLICQPFRWAAPATRVPAFFPCGVRRHVAAFPLRDMSRSSPTTVGSQLHAPSFSFQLFSLSVDQRPSAVKKLAANFFPLPSSFSQGSALGCDGGTFCKPLKNKCLKQNQAKKRENREMYAKKVNKG